MTPYRSWQWLMLRTMMPGALWPWLARTYAPLGPGFSGRFARRTARARRLRSQFARRWEPAIGSSQQAPARARALIPYDTAGVTAGQGREGETAARERSGSGGGSQQRSSARSSARNQSGQSATEAKATEPTSES